MSQITDAADLYLSCREFGIKNKQVYTVRDVANSQIGISSKEETISHELTEQIKQIEIDNFNLNNELVDTNRKYVDLVGQVIEFKSIVTEIFKQIDSLRCGYEDNPIYLLKRLEKRTEALEIKIEQATSSIDIEVEIKKLHELSIRKQSFRFNPKIKEVV